MTNDEAKALGLRAVECQGWRWLPGMLVRQSVNIEIHFEGVKVVQPAGRNWRFLTLTDSGSLSCAGNTLPDDRNTYLPDLSDPCTLGGLLHLVREAWGDDAIYTIPEMGLTGWACCTRRMTGRGPSEAAALVAALEAAPER